MRVLASIAVFIALWCVGSRAHADVRHRHDRSVLFSPAQMFFISQHSPVADMSGDSGMLAITGDGRSTWMDTPANRVHNGELLFSISPEVRGWSRRAPVSPVQTACTSPYDPRCRVSAPSSVPGRFQFEHPDHGLLAAPTPPSVAAASMIPPVAHPALRVRVFVSDGFIPSPWRPPALTRNRIVVA